MMSGPPAAVRFALAALLIVSTANAEADRLRNVEVGQPLPPFSVAGLDGEPVSSEDAAGKILVLVYLNPRQRQSEEAFEAAHRVSSKIGSKELSLVYMSADSAEDDYFRQLRDRLMAHERFGLDQDRDYYGRLGLIVFPTTVVSSKDGRLLHVIAGCTRDYERRLEAYCRHGLGEFDDGELEKRLSSKPRVKDDARAKAERHLEVAAVLRAKGMTDGAVQELEKAIKLDPGQVDAVAELADLLLEQGRLDAAEEQIADLRSRQPDSRQVKLLQGLMALKRDRLDEAEKLLKEALALNPDPVRAHYYLGQAYEKKGDYQSAAQHYREALKRAMRDR